MFKILICTYKASDCLHIQLEILKRMGLLSQVIIYENSPIDFLDNDVILNKYGVKFIDNPGGLHAQTVDKALNEITEPYVLLLDEDCFLKQNPITIFSKIIFPQKIQLFGDVNLSRGNQLLYPRICPWYCWIDNNWRKNKNIHYYDYKFVESTDSIGYYDVFSSEHDSQKYYLRNQRRYDVGSMFFKFCQENNGYISCFGDFTYISNFTPENFYIHIEGSSWQESDLRYKSFFDNKNLTLINNLKKQLGI